MTTPKFRVWYQGKMWRVEAMFFEARTYIETEGQLTPPSNGLIEFGLIRTEGMHEVKCSVPFKDCQLMQFTGVLDKNNKEVCVGDVIKYVDSDELGENPIDVSNVVISPFESFTWWWKFSCLKSKDIEIIGNRYQNHELLK